MAAVGVVSVAKRCEPHQTRGRSELTMRVRKSKAGLTVNVVAGTHVVFLGFDLTPAKRKGLRGFATRSFRLAPHRSV